MEKRMRVNGPGKQQEPPVDAETIRLSDLQLEFLELRGIHVGPAQRRALAAEARKRGVE